MLGFFEGLTAVAVITIGVVFGGLVVLAVAHTLALLGWMRRHAETLPARITDMTAVGQSGRGATYYRLEAEFERQGETRRILTKSGYHLGPLFERRSVKKKLDRWQAREVRILYCPEIPRWLAARGPREVAYVRGMIWRDALFAAMTAAAIVIIAILLIG